MKNFALKNKTLKNQYFENFVGYTSYSSMPCSLCDFFDTSISPGKRDNI